MKKGQYTLESWMMANGKEGDFFYSEKMDRHLTAIATHYKRKIITERLITITTAKSIPVAKNITKVILLNWFEKPEAGGQKIKQKDY